MLRPYFGDGSQVSVNPSATIAVWGLSDSCEYPVRFRHFTEKAILGTLSFEALRFLLCKLFIAPMKVIYKSENKLALQFCPWFKWTFVSVFNICAIVVLFALLALTWETFECNRNLALPTQGHCTITQHNWISKRQRSWQLEEIKDVTLKTVGSERRGSLRYQIQLVTTTGIIEQAEVYPKRSQQEEIQQFLKAQRSRIKFQRDLRSYAFFCFTLCLAGAAVFGIWAERVTLEISRYTQRLTLKRRNWIRTRTTEYPLDQIAEVTVQKKRGGKFGPMGRIAIALKDGKTIVVHPYDRFDTEGNGHERSAAMICRFLAL